jgi:FAD/FMN-containing dehydrogenase
VHWGKLHYLTRPQLHARYPQAEAFVAIRRRLDPDGVFLNAHLAELFA